MRVACAWPARGNLTPALGQSEIRAGDDHGATLVRETALAWTLAEAVKPHLSAIERNHVFVAIGAGETFAAMRGLVKSVAVKRIALRFDLVQQCIAWLHTYVGHKDERYLRRLIEDYLVPCSIHIPTTVRVNSLPTTTKPRQLVALTSL